MASGAADRFDVTAWTPTTRTGWEAAGVAARAGASSQDRFGAALEAARARDDATAVQSRTASQRDSAEATRTRQASQRDAADASRASAERARDAAADADARIADRRAAAAKPTAAPHTPANASRVADASAPGDPRPATTPPPTQAAPSQDTAKADAAVQKTAAAQASAPRLAAEAPSAGTDGAESAGTAVQTPQPNTAVQTAPADPAATLLSLLAAMSGGAIAATADPVADAEGLDGETAAGAASTGTGNTVPAAISGAPTMGAGAATAVPPGADVSGISGLGGAKASAAAMGSGKIESGADPVAAGSTGSIDPASAATGPGQDFLSALADAGQAGGQGAAPGTAAGAPQAPSPTISGVSPATPAPSSAATSAAQASSATAQTTPTPQMDPAIPIGQVPMTIGLRSLNGSNAFQIRLDPVELGRIEVKLEIDKARGTVTTHLMVDRPETLAMLQRDAGQLQQALTQAGLDPSAGGLNLSLRDGGAQTGGGNSQQGSSFQGGSAGWTREQAEAPQETAPTRWLRGYGGLDIRI